jgi:hypothetical protein
LDAETEISIDIGIAPTNRHGKTFFCRLYATAKKNFYVHIATNLKFIADA